MKLSNHTAFVTGGSSGLGLALAQALLARGNQVIICGRDVARLEQARAQNPGLATIRCDLTRDDEVRRMVVHLTRRFPRLNLLVNSAAIGRDYTFHRDLDALRHAELELATNLAAPVRLTRYLLQYLVHQPESAVVNVSSALAYVPRAASPIYGATRAGLHFFTRALRQQLRGTAVKIFEVLPPPCRRSCPSGAASLDLPQLAEEALRGVERDRFEIRTGRTRGIYALSRLAPGFLERRLA